MKRKYVLRLLAVAMAASLVATNGVPGTALVGIETVYADGVTVASKGRNSISVTGLETSDYYAIVKKTVYDASGFGETKANTLTWKQGNANVTFENLDALTSYYVLRIEAANYSASSTMSLNKVSIVTGLGSGTDYVTTDGIDITDATVVLDQTSYTYSAKGITPKVKSITVNGTTISGDELTKLFKVSTIKAVDATVANSGKATAVVTPIEGAEGQKYTGTVNTPAITITALDLSSAAADAYITNSSDGTRGDLASVANGTNNNKQSSLYVFAEDQTTALVANSDYYVTYDNIKAVGTATVTVNGTGNYTGTVSKTYKITKTASASVTKPTVEVSATTTSLKASITADDETIAANSYEFSISTLQNPASRTWVDADKEGKYSFTTCDGSALVAGTTYYIVGRIKESTTAEASGLSTAQSATLATGDLSQATIALTDGTTAVTGTTYTYDGTAKNPTIKVTLGGKDLTVNSDYDVTYNYVTKNDDGSDKLGDDVNANELTAAGTVRVTITPHSTSKLCGTKTIDFVINKKAVTAAVAFAAADQTKVYDSTATLETTAAAALVFADATPVAADSLSTLTSAAAGELTLTLSGTDVGEQTVTAIDYSAISVLKNYEVTFTDLSTKKVTITKQNSVTFTNMDGQALVKKADATYGKPLTLDIANNAGLAMTYTVKSGYEDYISVDSKGVVTVKKYDANVTPIVVVSVAKADTTNYNSSATEPVEIVLSLKKASTDVTIDGKDASKTLSVRPDATEAEILKALNVVLKYQNCADGTDPLTYTEIKLDTTNSSVTYKNNSTNVVSKTKPTEVGEYTVVVAYTGADAASLDKNASDGNSKTITLTVAKDADSLTENTVVTTPVVEKAHLETDEVSGVTYLYGDDGKLVKSGFQDVDGKTYYANANGVIVTGKVFTAKGTGKKFYAMKDGTIRKDGVYSIAGGGKVYAYADGHLLVSGSKDVNGTKYVADKNGKLVKEGFTTTAKGYKYYVKNYKVVKNQLINYTNGKTYIATATGTIAKGNKVVTFNGKKYYVYAAGSVAKSKTVTYKGKTYTANKNGVLKLKK
jgi:hypothetical protein